MSVTDSLAGEIIPVDGLLLRTVMCGVCSNSEGLTPLLIAASYGHCETVQLLLDAGGDVCQTDDDDNDAVSYAQQSGCHQCYALVSHYCGLCPSLLYLSV